MAAEYPTLPLTQASVQSPNVFVAPSGFPISVYLDVNPEIFSRPRLIRLLRTSGADICHSPADAAIILINSDTESGLKFVHDWSADTHKTVLSYGWIQACLRSGRALLEVDDWGGFHVLHTSDCMYSDDDDEMEDDTPVKGRRSELSQSAMRPKSPVSPAARHAKPNRRAPNSLPARPAHKLVSPTVVPPSPIAGTSSQNTSTNLQPATASGNLTLSSSAPSQQGSMPQSHVFPRADVISPPTPQVPGAPASQVFPLATNHPDPQQSSTDPLNLLHALNSAYQFQNAASQTLTQLVETIIAVAQRQGIDTAVIQNYLATLPMSSSQQHPSSSLAPQSLHAHSPTSHTLSEKPADSISDLPPEDVDQSPSSVPTPRRPVQHDSPPPVKRRKSLPEPQAKKVKKAAPHKQKNPPGPVSKPRPTKGIFTSKNGQPILVFVQVDTRGRHEFVHLVKKNGGQITADIPRASFVILNPRSVSYADLRREAEDSGRTIVQTTFITESVREGHLVNPNDYLLEDTRKKKVARRTASFRDKHSPESDHEVSEAQTSDTVVDNLAPAREREPSTTPEPPMAVQLKNGYKFTPAEMTYTWMLLRRILAKDPRATKQTVIKALYKKMPHHSEASWMYTLSRHKDMYEAIRTEAFHPPEAHPSDSRQPQDASDADMNEVDREADELDELQVGASLIPAEAEPMQEDEQQSPVKVENKDETISDAYARDFEALVEFLASADAEGGGDDEIFARLREKHVCESASNWSEFLEHHVGAVTEEVERRYATQNDG